MVSDDSTRAAGAACRVSTLRDVGGLVAQDGSRVAMGRLFRSGAPQHLIGDELVRLRSLRICTVCDLRSPDELHDEVVDWQHEPPLALHLPVLPDRRTTGDELIRPMLSDPTGRIVREHMIEAYQAMPAGFEPSLRRLVDALLGPDRLPLLVHCTEGKDRTGFVCALLLLTLGVDRATVFDDYLWSRRFFDRERMRRRIMRGLAAPLAEPPSDRAMDAFSCEADYLEAALRVVVAEHGSIEGYMERAGGLDAAGRRLLRSRLLE
jgi:protein-tyrosine phosphatase